MMTKAKTIRTGILGKKEIRLVKESGVFVGLVDGKICVKGDGADDVWVRLHEEIGKDNPKYFGFDGARNRFLKFFSSGFYSERYEAEERKYKVAAKERLHKTVPLEEAVKGQGFGEAVLSVFRATNLLSPYEKTRLQDVLRGPNSDEFIQATAEFALNASKVNLIRIEQALKPHDSAKWTVATYLPFLWRPEKHMFLKPEVTKEFAARVGHMLLEVYSPRLNFSVYQSLLDLAAQTEAKLVDMKPRDNIDIQSVIWVVGDYKEGRELTGV